MIEVSGPERVECICALVDFSIGDTAGLEGIEDITVCMDVIDRLARRRMPIPAEHMVSLIENSPYPDELLEELPAAYRCYERFREVAVAVAKSEFDYNVASLQTFGNDFWETAYRHSRAKGDLLEAYTIVRLAIRGKAAITDQLDWVLPVNAEVYPVGLPFDTEIGRRIVPEIHARLQSQGLVLDVLKLPRKRFQRWGKMKDWPVGIGLALSLDEQARIEPTALTLQVLAIAAWASTEQKGSIAA